MRFTTACVAAGVLGSTLAHPVEKRADTLPPVDSAMDESVLQLALYLEHLELSLYTGGYENFTDAQYTAAGFPPGFRENVGVIAQVRLIWRTCWMETEPDKNLHSMKQLIPTLSAPSSPKPATPRYLHAVTRFPTTAPPPSSILPT